MGQTGYKCKGGISLVNGRLSLTDAELFYAEEGEGEPLIFLHGNFNDHRIWSRQVPYFKDRFRVIRYGLRGYGQSSTPHNPFSHAEDLRALMEHLGLEKAHLVGSSMGGAVAIDFALAHPAQVLSLILAAPSVNGVHYPRKMTWKGIQNYIFVRIRGHQAAIESFVRDRFWEYVFPADSKAEARQFVLDNVRDPRNFCRTPVKYLKSGSASSLARTHELTLPALILIGDKDHAFNIRTAELLETQMKSASKITLPDCGHLPFVEHPSAFNERVMRFLR